MDAPVNIALIATYPEISMLFTEIAAERTDIVAQDIYASFDDAVREAKKLESRTDVIISRGGTGEFIRENVSIPVVQLPITPFDVVLAMQKLPAGTREFALSHYNSPIYGLSEIEKIYGVTIHEYTFETLQDIEKSVEDIKRKGLENLLGGHVITNMVREQGIFSVTLSAGVDTVNRAINEGVSIVHEARKERNRTARLAAAFNSITAGLILTDEDNGVLVCNPVADKLFNHQYPIGRRFADKETGPKLQEALKNKSPQVNYVRKIQNTLINTSHMPVHLDDKFIGFVHTFEDVTKIQMLEQAIRKQMHDKGFVARYRFEDIFTLDPTMDMLKSTAESYAQSKSSVHIEGESGTGKELFAQSIHNASPRGKMPFVAVNCAAIPPNLLESELFGYEAGAFTGAKKEGRQGLFEIAHNGTIFLDEVGDLPKEFQARLLRVLQEKELMRVGGSKVIPVDVRVISATNKNLRELAASGEFREDLFYRLSVFTIKIPPLRERACDIEPLCRKFLEEHGVTSDNAVIRFFMPKLLAHGWPGNVRELGNISERLAHLALTNKDGKPDQLDLALGLGLKPQEKPGIAINLDIDNYPNLKSMMENIEWQVIDHMLKLYDRKFAAVSKRLDIGRTTLWRKYNRTYDQESSPENQPRAAGGSTLYSGRAEK